MAKKFGSRSTADAVLEGVDLSGKNIVVTGANAGIGFETAKALAKAGGHVVLACRSASKANEAIDKIKQEVSSASVVFMALDLASFPSIKDFADNLGLDKLDILINNAGMMATEYKTTPQGHEITAGVNHFGHFYLTKLLLPLLIKSSARVVTVASESHRQSKALDFDKWPENEKDFGFHSAYAKSKLANILFAKELNKRYSEKGLTSTACHPGNLVTTDFGEGMPLINLLFKLLSPFTKTPAQGASTSVFCATQPAELVGGHYFSGNEKTRATKIANNEKLAEKLWEYSEKEVVKHT